MTIGLEKQTEAPTTKTQRQKEVQRQTGIPKKLKRHIETGQERDRYVAADKESRRRRCAEESFPRVPSVQAFYVPA